MRTLLRQPNKQIIMWIAVFLGGAITSKGIAALSPFGLTHAFSGISLADLARPEVFVPAFLLLTLGMIALFMEAEEPGKRAASGRKSTSNGGQAAPTASNAVEEEALMQSRQDIEKHLASILSSVGAYVQSSGRYSKSLDDANSELNVALSLDHVKHIVQLLVKENARASLEASRLRGNLETTTQRLVAMRDRLNEARTLASIDAVTGIANRRAHDLFLKEAVASSHDDLTPLCLILADIDNFKRVNDTHGHQAGDDVLREFSKILKTSVRTSDFVGRYGGEEFSIILPRTAPGSALAIAERLKERLAQVNFRFNGKQIGRVTASFGIAAIQPSELPGQLEARADKKVYEAKANGRNRIEIDTSECA